MLEKMEVRSSLGATIDLHLSESSNGYYISDITGEGTVRAVVVSSSFSTRDGEQYQSSRREKRNLLITVEFEPDYVTNTVESLRDELEAFFMPKTQVRLRFFSDTKPTVEIFGRVESFDSPRFSAEPDAKISILCHNPDFAGLDTVTYSGSTTATTTETTLAYSGTIETGFLFALNLDRTLSEFTIHHRREDGAVGLLEFVSPTPLASGSVIKISTIDGAKYARAVVSGVESSVLYALSPQSNWLNLYRGDNFIRVFAEGEAIPYTIQYVRKYGSL